jgi:hypothetical protein
MTETQALVALLAVGLAAAVISRRYLGRDAQLVVAGVGLVHALATLAASEH